MRRTSLTTTAWALRGRRAHTLRLAIRCMFLPPGFGQRQEAYNQILQGGQGQKGGFRARRGREIAAGYGDVTILVRSDLDLGMAHVARQTGQPGEFQRSSEERMAGVVNCDFPLAFLLDQRGITLGEVFPFRWAP